MRGSDNRLPLLAAFFVALLFAAMPGSAEAQTPLPSGAAPSCTGLTGVQLCQCQLSNANVQRAQAKSMAQLRIYNNAANPGMRLMYCFDTIKAMFKAIGAATAGGAGNFLSAIFWTIVLGIIDSFIDQICSLVKGVISSAINMVKNLVCIPIPHFNLSFGAKFSFGGGSCGGINLFNLLGIGATRPITPANWQIWNYSPVGVAP